MNRRGQSSPGSKGSRPQAVAAGVGDQPRSSPVWVYVAGSGRSGSTVLGVLMTRATRAFNCGELRELWDSLEAGRRCQCGSVLADCDLWASVVDDVRRTLGVDFAAAMEARRARRHWSRTARRFAWLSPLDVALRNATEQAIERVTGASIIIDTSKLQQALATAARRQRRMVVIHLVRDPRGVAFSRRRPKAIPHLSVVLPPHPIWKSARRWDLDNGQTEYRLWQARRKPWVVSTRLTYEQLADEPERAIAPIVKLIGGAESAPSPLSGHAIAGNTALYEERSVQIDRRWHRDMTRRDRAITVALTAPLLYRYGYPLRRPAAGAQFD
jgi:hypothetical protein